MNIEDIGKEAIKRMILEDNPILNLLKRQLESIKIDKIEETEKGLSIYYLVESDDCLVRDYDFEMAATCQVEGFNGSVRLVLHVKKGRINLLEGSIEEGSFPKEIENFDLKLEENDIEEWTGLYHKTLER